MQFFYNLASPLYFVSNLSPDHVSMEYEDITRYLSPMYIINYIYSIVNIISTIQSHYSSCLSILNIIIFIIKDVDRNVQW